ncbi:MAG TPA: FAD-dependent thymidylate synthase, partial [Candidatus Marinimicrobia bacterium]|nr:FAD-dependent thymidylate synthase [Candidatus Neomarinimicrobiota bacterium]
MSHVVVPEAEALLDKEIKVLDHGFIRLVDYMGGDSRIVQSARVSYGKGTKSVREDEALIDYLMRHQHTSPFEQVVLTFHCKMPIFIARQWIRHRAARVNEISGRYSVMEDEFYLPEETAIQYQNKDNRQGRDPQEVPVHLRQKVLDILTKGQQVAYDDYQKMLADDIARELARINLPLSLYTQWYWQIDLHNLFHFLELRMDEHAQWEIRQYANVIADITRAVAPLAFRAFETHVVNAVRFSGSEIQALA